MSRIDGRDPMALRAIDFVPHIQPACAGSVLIRWGQTHVICAASIEDRVPPHRFDSGGGWLTAEYAMLAWEWPTYPTVTQWGERSHGRDPTSHWSKP